MLKRNNKSEEFLVIFMTFFIFAGYYIGLTIILASGFKEFSRFYSLPLRVVSFLVAIFYIFQYKRNNVKIRIPDFLISFLFLFYIIKVLYTENSVVQFKLLRSWYEYIFYFLLFNYGIYLFFRNIDVKKHLSTIVNTLLFSGFLLGIVVILFYKEFLFASEIGRFGSNIENNEEVVLSPLAIAYSGALNVSLLVSIFFQKFKKYSFILKIYYITNFLLSMFLFVLGSTRGAFIVVILAILLFIYAQKGMKKVKYIFYIIPIVPLFFLYLNYTESSLLERLTNTVESQDSSGRDVLWSDALYEFGLHPIFGGKIEVSGIYPHNILLEILMGMGIVGFVLFIFFVIISMKSVKLNNMSIYIYIIFVNGFFQYMFSGALYASIILFFAMGLFNGYKYGK